MTPELPKNITLDMYVQAKTDHPDDNFSKLFALYRMIDGFEGKTQIECPYVAKNYTADGTLTIQGRAVKGEEELFVSIIHEEENRTTHRVAFRRDAEGNLRPYYYSGTKDRKIKIWFKGDNSGLQKSAIKTSLLMLHGAWNSIDQACKAYIEQGGE